MLNRTALATCLFSCAALSATASASTLGEAIGQQVEINTYKHYLIDLLYTHLGESRAFNDEHDLARDNIEEVFIGLGLDTVLEPFSYGGSTYHNIVATQVGSELPDEVIVVGAHFDSVPNGPGADDNGTGSAVVMEVARVLSQHRSARTIKYVLFDREEQGRVGSIAFVNAHADENIVMAVTADMVGHDSGAYGMDIYGTAASSAVVNGIDQAIETYGGTLGGFLNVGNFGFSDHWSFESAGIPAFVLIEDCYTCNDRYHTPNDAVDIEPGYINYPMLTDLLHSIVGYLVDEAAVTVFGDATGDGLVNVEDLLQVILDWGPCPDPPADCPSDLSGDGQVDVTDLIETVVNWG